MTWDENRRSHRSHRSADRSLTLHRFAEELMQNRFVEIPALHQSGLYPRSGGQKNDDTELKPLKSDWSI